MSLRYAGLCLCVVGLALGACSSKKSSTDSKPDGGAPPSGSSGSSGPGGGAGGGACEDYGRKIAEKAPNCGEGDLAATFAAGCKVVRDPMTTCTTEYEAVLACQAEGAKCAEAKVLLGECADESSKYSSCTTTVADGGGSSCTLPKGSACQSSGSQQCCAGEKYDCAYTTSADSRNCCGTAKAACDSPADCCQLRSKNGVEACESGKCCMTKGQSCADPSECCSAAPNCTDGECAP